MVTDYFHFKSISLAKRARVLHWVCTGLVLVPALVMAALVFVLDFLPRTFAEKRISRLLGKMRSLAAWRDWQVREYITYERQGFRMYVE